MPRYRMPRRSHTSFHAEVVSGDMHLRNTTRRICPAFLQKCQVDDDSRLLLAIAVFALSNAFFFSRALPKHASRLVVATGLGGHRASLHRVNMSGLASLMPFPANPYMGRYGMGLVHFPPFGGRQPSAPPAPHLADMRLATDRFYKGDFVSLLVQERPVYVSEYVYVG